MTQRDSRPLLWRPWQVAERWAERIVMGARLHPLPGYPFTLDVRVAYELGEMGCPGWP